MGGLQRQCFVPQICPRYSDPCFVDAYGAAAPGSPGPVQGRRALLQMAQRQTPLFSETTHLWQVFFTKNKITYRIIYMIS